jgi:hypothetical protein
MVRNLAHVVEHETAKIGVFITLTNPTAPTKTEAIKAGYYESPHRGKMPKKQIFTIEELFAWKKSQRPIRHAIQSASVFIRARSRFRPPRSFRCNAMSKADGEWNPVR